MNETYFDTNTTSYNETLTNINRTTEGDGVVFALIFCIVWSLRRSIVPSVFHIDLGGDAVEFRILIKKSF
uniref:Uncharacterized protein n=1 Tax=Heterorhabditis bacteriophora TaxID=37862 RepID=A0A1I7X1J0_HETBA